MSEYRYIGRTDPGLVRDNNEDSFVAMRIDGSPMLLCAVVDGMGGYEGGEVAASVAAEAIQSFVLAHLDEKPLDLVKMALTQANNAVFRRRRADSRFPEMGCVASVALVDTERRMAHIAHVGDTRIYLYGPEGLRKITHDHSLVGYMEDHQDITEFQAMNHPQRNEVDRFLGDSLREVGEDGFIESGIYPVPADGKLLLCSDGLTDMVTSREISDILSSFEETATKADMLVAAANSNGGKDNVTVVLAEFFQDPADIEPVVPATVSEDEEAVAEEDTGKRRTVPLWMLPAVLVLGLLIGYMLGVFLPVF